MNSPRIDSNLTFFPHHIAEAKAAALQESDPEWSYFALPCIVGPYSIILAIDEEGALLGNF